MADQEHQRAWRDLEQAIKDIKATCGDDPEYKDLISACNKCMQELRKVEADPDAGDEDSEPTNLKDANERARTTLRTANKADRKAAYEKKEAA